MVRVVANADCITVQLEGHSLHLPPLAYLSLLTCYMAVALGPEQIALLNGTFFVDVHENSVWHQALPLWVCSHQTSHHNSLIKSALCDYVQLLPKDALATGSCCPSKCLKCKERAQKASVACDVGTHRFWGLGVTKFSVHPFVRHNGWRSLRDVKRNEERQRAQRNEIH
jgi:hypothetical protein